MYKKLTNVEGITGPMGKAGMCEKQRTQNDTAEWRQGGRVVKLKDHVRNNSTQKQKRTGWYLTTS